MNVPDYTVALVVAVPLLGAFLTPLVGRINDKLRNIFVIIVLALNAFLVFLLASDVLDTGIKTYVLALKTLGIQL